MSQTRNETLMTQYRSAFSIVLLVPLLACLLGSPAFAGPPGGSLLGWGENQLGQFNTPTGNDFVAIAAGNIHGLALKSNGSLAGWGAEYGLSYNYGQADVPAGNDFVAVAAGPFHSLV